MAGCTPWAHNKSFSTLLVFLFLASVSGPDAARAGHDVFHIFTPAVEAGHVGFELLSTLQEVEAHGAAAEEEDGDEHGHAMPRTAHEAAVHTGVTSFWMSKLAFTFSREDGERYRADAIASENVFRFTPQRGGPLDLGWFTAVSAGLNGDATNAFEFGPILTLASGPLALTLNPFLEKTFGRKREDGIAFTYGWRATYAFSETFAIGVEGYGEVENIGDAPPVSEQVHRIGPVLYLGHMHGAVHGGHSGQSHHQGGASHGAHEHADEAGHPSHGGDLHAEIGLLFGLTQETPDVALKFNIGADF